MIDLDGYVLLDLYGDCEIYYSNVSHHIKVMQTGEFDFEESTFTSVQDAKLYIDRTFLNTRKSLSNNESLTLLNE